MKNVKQNKCPFCGNVVEYHEPCNGFCLCGAKYYSEDKIWLNRKTGEEVVEENE